MCGCPQLEWEQLALGLEMAAKGRFDPSNAIVKNHKLDVRMPAVGVGTTCIRIGEGCKGAI